MVLDHAGFFWFAFTWLDRKNWKGKNETKHLGIPSRSHIPTLLRRPEHEARDDGRPTPSRDYQPSRSAHGTANQFVVLARQFQSEIRVHCKGYECNGKSILDLTSLAAECGTHLDLEAFGSDAVAAVQALAVVIKARFYEDGNEGKDFS